MGENSNELIKAIKLNDVNKFDDWLNKGVDVMAINSTGETALFIAAQQENNKFILKILPSLEAIYFKIFASSEFKVDSIEELIEQLIGENFDTLDHQMDSLPANKVLIKSSELQLLIFMQLSLEQGKFDNVSLFVNLCIENEIIINDSIKSFIAKVEEQVKIHSHLARLNNCSYSDAKKLNKPSNKSGDSNVVTPEAVSHQSNDNVKQVAPQLAKTVETAISQKPQSGIDVVANQVFIEKIFFLKQHLSNRLVITTNPSGAMSNFNLTVESVNIKFEDQDLINGFKLRLRLVDGENIIETIGDTIVLNKFSIEIIHSIIS